MVGIKTGREAKEMLQEKKMSYGLLGRGSNGGRTYGSEPVARRFYGTEGLRPVDASAVAQAGFVTVFFVIVAFGDDEEATTGDFTFVGGFEPKGGAGSVWDPVVADCGHD